ncbi:MAG: hypothetical protein LLG20_13390 [Acidobacteriales bacterium]|nr:hypothetical protein [Terriglobales bacterium]
MNPAATPTMDGLNGRVFLFTYMMLYLAAPVVYVGVVQAALCDKLGASATVANMPLAAYQLGQFSPLLATWLIPHRLERTVLVWTASVAALLQGMVVAVLMIPFPASVRIGVVTMQGLLLGLVWSVGMLYLYQCLNRGTSLEGRARALKLTYSMGPLAAVAGSLAAQYVLNPGFRWLPFPYDFAGIYAFGFLATVVVAVLSTRYDLLPVADEPRPPIRRFLSGLFAEYLSNRTLWLLWLAFLLWSCTLGSVANVSLYTREAMGRDPKDFSGLIMAIRFSAKALAGYGLGWLALRYGLRTASQATSGLFAAGMLWAWLVPGTAFLGAFGWLGGGELGGVYFPNYALALTSLASGPRVLAALMLATPVSGFAPVMHGWLTDHFGFAASFAFGLATALAAAACVRKR